MQHAHKSGYGRSLRLVLRSSGDGDPVRPRDIAWSGRRRRGVRLGHASAWPTFWRSLGLRLAFARHSINACALVVAAVVFLLPAAHAAQPAPWQPQTQACLNLWQPHYPIVGDWVYAMAGDCVARSYAPTRTAGAERIKTCQRRVWSETYNLCAACGRSRVDLILECILRGR